MSQVIPVFLLADDPEVPPRLSDVFGERFRVHVQPAEERPAPPFVFERHPDFSEVASRPEVGFMISLVFGIIGPPDIE